MDDRWIGNERIAREWMTHLLRELTYPLYFQAFSLTQKRRLKIHAIPLSTMQKSIYRNLSALLTCLFLMGAANAAVTEWKMVKAINYQQTADNSSTLNGGVLDIEVVTEGTGEATSVTISGGGISGSHAFEQENGEWSLEMDFGSEAALDAEFPSGTTYTITLSGGTLGTLTQTVNFPAKAYPNVPFLTGTEFTKLQALDPASNFFLAFSDPGSLTEASGQTGFGIYDLADDNDFLYHGEVGAATSFDILVSEFDASLVAGTDYLGFIEYSHAAWASGIGGFSVYGTVSHNRAVEFGIHASAPSAGSVVSWNFIKGQGATQVANDAAPAITDWDIDSEVVIEKVGDATSVTISGGGISGSLAYEQDGLEWSFHKGYDAEGSVDAEFPSSSIYTITLSGGALGTLTQTVNLGAKAYPTHPVLTGTTLSDLQSIDSSSAYQMTFNAPGASANRTEIEIEFINSDEDSPFFSNFDSSLGTSSTIPANALPEGTTFEAYIDHFKTETVSGAGGFGVDGLVVYDSFSGFGVTTIASSSSSLSPIVGAWQFGDGGAEPSGVVVFLENETYFHAEDTVATAEGFDGMERGTYTWNAATGALIATPILDTNGDIGLSHPLSPFVLVVDGDQLVGGDEPDDPGVLNRVVPVDGAMTGAWQFGNGGDEPSGVVVFLANGTYFHAEDTEATDEGWDGMERGTYTWNSATGVLVATPILDTNGDIGLSHPLSPFVFSIDGDRLLGGDGEDVGLVRVGLEGASIADAGLEQALRDALDKQAGRLTVLDLQSLTSLNASNRMISSLEGLEDAPELETLDLSNNQITDIGPIAELEKLVSLDISSNLLADTVVSQSDLGNKGQMSLFSVSIQAEPATGKLSPLSGLTTLETLLLANNQISDLSSLVTLTLLEEVDLSGNDVTDITPLASLAALKIVDFSDNEITDLAPLVGLENLEEVTLFDNPALSSSSQLDIIEQLSGNGEVVVVTVEPAIIESVIKIEYDEDSGVSELVWSEVGVLQTSADFNTWTDVPNATSPYEISFDPEGPKFWRIKKP